MNCSITAGRYRCSTTMLWAGKYLSNRCHPSSSGSALSCGCSPLWISLKKYFLVIQLFEIQFHLFRYMIMFTWYSQQIRPSITFELLHAASYYSSPVRYFVNAYFDTCRQSFDIVLALLNERSVAEVSYKHNNLNDSSFKLSKNITRLKLWYVYTTIKLFIH